MIRVSLIVACCLLPFSGCGQLGDLVADEAAADGSAAGADASSQPQPSDNDDVKTPLIRALLQTVDEAKGESSEVKDSLKKSLREADEELAKVLGGKSKQLIMQANKKPPALVIGGPQRPPLKPKQDGKSDKPQESPATPQEEDQKPTAEKQPAAEQAAEQPAEKSAEKPSQASPSKSAAAGDAAEEDEVKTPMVRALLETVDQVEGEGDDVKKEMKRLLREADKELSKVLRGNSRQLIMKANRKPPSPVVGGTGSRGVKVREFKQP